MRENLVTTDRRKVVEVQEKIPNPLLGVLSWEIYRLTRKRSIWILSLIIFALFSFFTWVLKAQIGFSYSNGVEGVRILVNIGTAWGIAHILALPLLAIFGLLIPYIAAEGISLDLKRRTHELLMTTAIPTWAYLGGRFLAVLLVSFGLSGIMMVAVVVTPKVIGYGVPDLWAVLYLWLLMVIPAVILLSGVSFALTIWLPRFSNTIKIGVLVTWIGIAFVTTYIQPFSQHDNGKYMEIDRQSITLAALFDPTSSLMSKILDERYQEAFSNKVFDPASIKIVTQPEANFIYRTVAQSRPDVTPWLLPHFVLILVGLLLVLGAGSRFRRFAESLK